MTTVRSEGGGAARSGGAEAPELQRAAPIATTDFGLSCTLGAMPSARQSLSATSGIRLEPPTR